MSIVPMLQSIYTEEQFHQLETNGTIAYIKRKEEHPVKVPVKEYLQPGWVEIALSMEYDV